MATGEVNIDVSSVRGKRVMVATPMYGGLGNTMYITSLLQFQDQCHQRGVVMEHCFMMNESLIDRGRNGLANEFMVKSKADFLLFIDADIQFRPEDIFAMMSFDKELICAPYPKKHINWPMIVASVKSGIENPETLEQLVGEYVFSTLDNNTKAEKIVKVAEGGTGLMLIKRSVFEKMREAFPENEYLSDHSEDVIKGTEKKMFAYFRTGIFNKRYLSEDYYFCHKWREMGGDVWMFPWAITTHYGTYGFKGAMGAYIDAARRIQASGVLDERS